MINTGQVDLHVCRVTLDDHALKQDFISRRTAANTRLDIILHPFLHPSILLYYLTLNFVKTLLCYEIYYFRKFIML